MKQEAPEPGQLWRLKTEHDDIIVIVIEVGPMYRPGAHDVRSVVVCSMRLRAGEVFRHALSAAHWARVA